MEQLNASELANEPWLRMVNYLLSNTMINKYILVS